MARDQVGEFAGQPVRCQRHLFVGERRSSHPVRRTAADMANQIASALVKPCFDELVEGVAGQRPPDPVVAGGQKYSLHRIRGVGVRPSRASAVAAVERTVK